MISVARQQVSLAIIRQAVLLYIDVATWKICSLNAVEGLLQIGWSTSAEFR
jgi:hypothetical protein